MQNKKQIKFLRLYEPIHNRFERFCRARVYGEGDYQDLMHETLLVAFEKLDTLKSEKAFLSFLFSISVRLLANENRKKKPEMISQNQAEIASKTMVDDPSQSTEVYLLHQALAKLPQAQKEALILFEISGFSIKEIAVIQDASESAVKQRLKRGREGLRLLLVPELIQNEN